MEDRTYIKWTEPWKCGHKKRYLSRGFLVSTILFVITMIPLTLILRKSEAGYSYGNNVNINHLLFIDDLKLYAKTPNQLDSLIETVRIFINDIGMKFGIEKCAVLIIKRGKMTQSGGIRVQILRSIGS